MKDENRKKENLEDDFQKLEELVKDLESSDLSIEESLLKFKAGVGLIKECQKRLKRAKNEFIEISKELEDETA